MFVAGFENKLKIYEQNTETLDYLLKPISYNDFLAAAQHALKVIQPVAPPPIGRTQPQRSEEEIRSIFVKTEYRLQQIELDNITFIEGLKDYVKIHLADGSDPVLSLMRMKELEEKLPAGRFVRVQKSYIVQMSRLRPSSGPT